MKNKIFLAPSALKLFLNNDSFDNIIEKRRKDVVELLADNKILNKKSYNKILFGALHGDIIVTIKHSRIDLKLKSNSKSLDFINFLTQPKFKDYLDINILKEMNDCGYDLSYVLCLFRKDIPSAFLKDCLAQSSAQEAILTYLSNFYFDFGNFSPKMFANFLLKKDIAKVIDTAAIKQIIKSFPDLPLTPRFVDEISHNIFDNEADFMIDIVNNKFFIDNFFTTLFQKINKDSVLKEQVSKNKFVYQTAVLIECFFEDFNGDNYETRKNKDYQSILTFLKESMRCQPSLAKSEINILAKLSKENKVFATDLREIEASLLKDSIGKQLSPPRPTHKAIKI